MNRFKAVSRRLATDLDKDSAESWLGAMPTSQQQAEVAQGVISLMDADVKATGLKQIQGLIWKDGFTQGQNGGSPL